jgi:hypothetical protein
MTDHLDTVLDNLCATLDDLLMASDVAKIDKLAERFRKSAMKARPITAVEVIMAALQIMGETALEIIPNADQRKAVCAALAGHLVGDEVERLQ